MKTLSSVTLETLSLPESSK